MSGGLKTSIFLYNPIVSLLCDVKTISFNNIFYHNWRLNYASYEHDVAE